MEDRARVQRGRSYLLSFTAMGRSRAKGGLGQWGTEWDGFPREEKQEADNRDTPSLAQRVWS